MTITLEQYSKRCEEIKTEYRKKYDDACRSFYSEITKAEELNEEEELIIQEMQERIHAIQLGYENNEILIKGKKERNSRLEEIARERDRILNNIVETREELINQAWEEFKG